MVSGRIEFRIRIIHIDYIYYIYSKSTPNKQELCKELHKMFRGGETYQKLVMAHDTARIVQCLLKHSPAEICQEVSEVFVRILYATR